jgi:hypothetical protein
LGRVVAQLLAIVRLSFSHTQCAGGVCCTPGDGHPRVQANVGRLALQRGPLVYCAEQVDHGLNMQPPALPADAPLTSAARPDLLGGVTGRRVAEMGPARCWMNGSGVNGSAGMPASRPRNWRGACIRRERML